MQGYLNKFRLFILPKAKGGIQPEVSNLTTNKVSRLGKGRNLRLITQFYFQEKIYTKSTFF